MNIAILIPALGGGGAERVSQILGDYFVERGDKVYYFIGDNGIEQDYPVKGKIIKTNIKHCTINNRLGDLQGIFKLLISSMKMRKLKYDYKIDVAISFMEEFNYINVLSKGKEKVIVRVCTILSQRKELVAFLYKKCVVRFFYSKADKVIVMSDYGMRDMNQYYGVPLKKLFKIPNAVVEKDVLDGEALWPYGTKTVICVGRMEHVKQQDRIIRAFSYVVQEEKQAKLLLLGKGPNLDYLKKICQKYQIEKNVIFVGFTDKVSYYLRHSRVFVMASKVEGFPNSMIEAMNNGVPTITTDSPGACSEIVGKPEKKIDSNGFRLCEYGILTPVMPDEKLRPNSALSEQEIVLGKAMLKVLTDDDVYKRYHVQSLKRAEMFHIDNIIRKWNSIMM